MEGTGAISADLAPSNDFKLSVEIFGLGRRQALTRKRFTAEQIIMKLREAGEAGPGTDPPLPHAT